MKLLHVTDLHANRRWFKWVADYAEKYDVVAYTGDFFNIFCDESLGPQVRWITDWANALPRPLLWCSGNHDVESSVAPVLSGRWMAALPGARVFSKSGHAEVMELAFAQVGWRGTIPQRRADSIVLAHAPPAGSFAATAKGGGMDAGDMNLGDALRSSSSPPWLVLCGHIHHPARWVDRVGDVNIVLSERHLDHSFVVRLARVCPRKACFLRGSVESSGLSACGAL